MTVIIISIVAAWILFSALLVTIICMNSSRLNRIDEPSIYIQEKLNQLRRELDEESDHALPSTQP